MHATIKIHNHDTDVVLKMSTNEDDGSLYEAYEADVVPLKLADRRRNTTTVVAYISLQIILVLLLSVTLGLLGVIGFASAIFLLPSALVPMPSHYRITRSAVLWDRRRLNLGKISKVHPNEKRNFVSLISKWGGESVRLYTSEPQKINKIVMGIVRSRTALEPSS